MAKRTYEEAAVPGSGRDTARDRALDLQLRLKELPVIFDKVVPPASRWFGLRSCRGELSLKSLPTFLKGAADHLKLEAPVRRAFLSGDWTLLTYKFDCFDFNADGKIQCPEALCLVTSLLRDCSVQIQAASQAPLRFERSLSRCGFTKGELLGAGGQGEAYRCKDKDGNLRCMKIYSKLKKNAPKEEKLKVELKLMQELNSRYHSPYLAKAYDLFQTTDKFVMINEYFAGGDMTKLIKRADQQGVTRDEAWFGTLFKQILLAVQFLHKFLHIHCDIKEANIMLRYEDVRTPYPVLIDFDLATSFTIMAMHCGTAPYWPPEVLWPGVWVPTSDVFSVGVVAAQVMGWSRQYPTKTGYQYMLFPNNDFESKDDIKRERQVRSGPIDLSRMDGFPKAKDLVQRMLRSGYSGRVAERSAEVRPTASQCLEHPWMKASTEPPRASSGTSRGACSARKKASRS